MYAIKPWGKVVLVGSNVGTYAMGIGMRWRESIVRLVERRPDPRYELENHRRCVLTAQTMKLLKDLGCTTAKVENILRRARGWRFVRPDLEVVRESSTFPGCAEGEPAYHCSEGMLLRMLRSEFIRFGGNISWGTEAYDAFESGDGTGLWSLRKMYGMESEAEAIITTAKDSPLASLLIADDPNRIAVLFDEETGISPAEGTLTGKIFGSADVVLLVGEELVLHLWNIGDTVAWRAIRRGRKENPDLQTLALHPAIHEMVARSVQRTTRMRVLPATTPAVKDTSSHMRVSILGDALLPIDPFEWRGDRARCNIEEASALCRAFYGKKFHRGNVPHILREVEQDSLAKRAAVLRRDLMDAEHFLCGKFAIEEDFSTSGTLGAALPI
ncbi:hypothetical protein ERJ75_000350900 [Trypanosoma vivax]|uniref:FAD-binding domain-containing protein n=1 Tax=Trypanosoma vivax (strain Y486) TaxID=1055687 RepID=G0TV04_TRYVY|nr:hypothetical protein TRVL_06450 [Trypanosoma vivax]KAH8617684.1 hypothetical protein ERJ75_000350900 [Trypanosoma vivax]CCC47791.1 conserved hypothetical protein [Trypanosoma vivax Y486]